MNEIPLIFKVISVILTAGSMIPSSRRGMEEYIGDFPTKIVIACFTFFTILTIFGQSPGGIYELIFDKSKRGDNDTILDISDWDSADQGRRINIFGDMLFQSWSARVNYVSSAKIDVEMDDKYICTIQFSTDERETDKWKMSSRNPEEIIGVSRAGEDNFSEKKVNCPNYPFHITGIHTLGVSGSYKIGKNSFKFNVKYAFQTGETLYSPEIVMNDRGKVSIMFPLG